AKARRRRPGGAARAPQATYSATPRGTCCPHRKAAAPCARCAPRARRTRSRAARAHGSRRRRPALAPPYLRCSRPGAAAPRSSPQATVPLVVSSFLSSVVSAQDQQVAPPFLLIRAFV